MSSGEFDYLNDPDEIVERYSHQIGYEILDQLDSKPDYQIVKIETSEVADGKMSETNVGTALQNLNENLDCIGESGSIYRFLDDEDAENVGEHLLEVDGKPTYYHEVRLLEGIVRNYSEEYDRVLDMKTDLVRLVRTFDKELSEIISERNLKRRIERSERIEKENGSWVYSPDRMRKIK